MGDYLPTDGMAILGYITAGLCVILAIVIDGIIRVAERNQQQYDNMVLLAANEPYKPLHVEV